MNSLSLERRLIAGGVAFVALAAVCAWFVASAVGEPGWVTDLGGRLAAVHARRWPVTLGATIAVLALAFASTRVPPSQRAVATRVLVAFVCTGRRLLRVERRLAR